MCYERRRAEACVDESAHHALGPVGTRCVCFITAGPITKLFAWGRRVEDMCYERRRAEALDESAHHALVNAGGREIV